MKIAIIHNIETRKYNVILVNDEITKANRVLNSFKTFEAAQKWVTHLSIYDHFPEEDEFDDE